MPKSAGATAMYVLVGAILGGILGQLLGFLVPEGILHDVFVRGFPLGFSPPLTLDLKVFTFTIGFKLFVNLFSVLGMAAGFYWSR